MSHENGGCGPHEPAQLNTAYRALKLQSGGDAAVAVDLVVESAGKSQNLHLELGEVHSGTLVIKSGSLTGLLGYIS